MGSNKKLTWNFNIEGKSFTHELEFKAPSDNRPIWQKFGYLTEDEYIKSFCFIDSTNGKRYDFNGNEIL
jgi:hypothetical protein